MDITKMKLKKDLGLKKLNLPKLKEVQISSSLPRNSKLDNVFNISKGRPNTKGLSTHLRPMRKGKTLNKFSSRGKFNINNILPHKPYNGFNDVFKPSLTKSQGVRHIFNNKSLGGIKGLGSRRIKQQKGLKPWGDFDGDGLMNMLDCHPRNKNLQGPEHSLEDKINPEENLDNIVQQNGVENEPVIEEQSQDKDEPVTDETQAVEQNADIKEQQRRLAMEKRLFNEQKRADKLDLLTRTKEQRLRDAERKEKEQKNKEPTRAQKGLKRAENVGSAFGGAITSISQASRGFGGFGVSQQKLAGATGYNASQYKILSALGKAPPLPPPQTVQPQQTQQTTVQQAQANPQQGVQSPYSGRKVSYVRGPYKKTQQQQ